MASNITGNASANLRRWDPIGLAWVNVQTGMLAGAEVNFNYDLNEVWVSSYQKSSDTIGAPFTVDQSHNVSLTRQLNFAPFARFYIPYGGTMWAANCQIGGTRYRDRLYKSSGPTGVVAYSRSAQTDVPATVTLVDNTPTMTSNTTPIGVAAASTIYSAPNDAWHLFDDDQNFGWAPVSGTTTGWCSYDFGSGNSKTITYYSLVGLRIGDTDPTIGPKTWTLEGSPDNSAWTVLDTQTNAPSWAVGEKRIYPIANTTAYRYYRLNVSANQGHATVLVVGEMELLTSTTGVKALTLDVDSARYVKPTQVLDVYAAGTEDKMFTITILDVDKVNDSITFLPYQLNFATGAVNTSTDIITLSDASQFPTGTTIKFASTGTLPAPLAVGTTYYSIYMSPTTIKVASSLANAQAGIGIDITATGSGTHTILLSYVIGNRDELWGAGRKGQLTYYWNTDYRNPEDADWEKLPPSLDATNDITGVGTIASRLFIFTENMTFKYDGQNLTPLYNDVGCISNDTICYYQTFMVWLDAKGNVWSRNEAAGTETIISMGIQKTIALVPQSQLVNATAVCVGKILKITLGQFNLGGVTKTLRILYDFEANNWTTELFDAQMPVQLEYKYNNNIQPHFFDEHGNFWVDELGDDDAGQTIQMDCAIGDDQMQMVGARSITPLDVEEVKRFYGIKIYGKNATGTKIIIRIDGGDPIDVGEMTASVDAMAFPATVPKGSMINISFKNSATGDPVEIHKVIVYFDLEEDIFRAVKR